MRSGVPAALYLVVDVEWSTMARRRERSGGDRKGKGKGYHVLAACTAAVDGVCRASIVVYVFFSFIEGALDRGEADGSAMGAAFGCDRLDGTS